MLNALLEGSEISFKSCSIGKPMAESGVEPGFLRAQTSNHHKVPSTFLYSDLVGRLISVWVPASN